MKTTFQILTVLLFLAIAMPPSYGQSTTLDTAEGNHKYVKLQVDGLACPFCAYGLEKKLKNIPGVQNLHIDIQKGVATFRMPDRSEATKERLEEIVADAGFKARKVEFSTQPYRQPKEEQ